VIQVLEPAQVLEQPVELLTGLDQDLSQRLRLVHRRLDAVQAHEIRDFLDVVHDVVELGRERVDVLAVDRRDEGRVETLDDVVGDPVALLLGLEDVGREARFVGPALEKVAQELRRPKRVLPFFGEQIEEDAVLGNEGEPGHGCVNLAGGPEGGEAPQRVC
jgi:hypothetical protein